MIISKKTITKMEFRRTLILVLARSLFMPRAQVNYDKSIRNSNKVNSVEGPK